MVEFLHIDKQGRITIPAPIRNLLSLSDNSVIEIDVIANEIVLRKRSVVDSEKVDQWFQILCENSLTASKSDVLKDDSKYYDEDYVKHKLGL